MPGSDQREHGRQAGSLRESEDPVVRVAVESHVPDLGQPEEGGVDAFELGEGEEGGGGLLEPHSLPRVGGVGIVDRLLRLLPSRHVGVAETPVVQQRTVAEHQLHRRHPPLGRLTAEVLEEGRELGPEDGTVVAPTVEAEDSEAGSAGGRRGRRGGGGFRTGLVFIGLGWRGCCFCGRVRGAGGVNEGGHELMRSS